MASSDDKTQPHRPTVDDPKLEGAGEILLLSPEDQKRFVEAILNPPEPNAALRRAAKQHRKLIGP